VQLGLLPHKSTFVSFSTKDKATVAAAIEKVGLLNKQHDQFSILSGGEQQRALIARALVQGAKLLVLDEPTNHLDVFYQHQVLQLVNDLDLTVVMTVHDLNLAARYCDSLLLLNKGELVKHGDIAQVLDESLLSDIFSMPCQVRQSALSAHLQVDFYPHGQGENV
jgi:iron complex transport system ATP-binding protein